MASTANIVKKLRAANNNGWRANLDFFEWASSLKLSPRETTYEELQSILKMNRTETLSYAADIEKAGIGERIVGRRKAKSRIRWLYTPQSIAAAARGLSDNLEPVSSSNFPVATASADVVSSAQDSGEADHVFQLRRDRRVTFRLPKDLTSKEADRLAAFLKTLPME
ncbi:hypothetical protein BST63_18880 [Bradyrhizobium canariense]|uniref:Uncharacterized protein n=1 Tax=Bradyrhizobium canariense TaxID=255045 RepID=A0ABX3X224_9BRAD|nr:hypothetical protein [Bradyrhizobium canariense]OSJ13746.1 hypothetical protein BSR47_19735 [Bradyrhizobium canariense]OSJ27808.1 hypothetical protein BST63_18880 [Bradyrhizobium canariense]